MTKVKDGKLQIPSVYPKQLPVSEWWKLRWASERMRLLSLPLLSERLATDTVGGRDKRRRRVVCDEYHGFYTEDETK